MVRQTHLPSPCPTKVNKPFLASTDQTQKLNTGGCVKIEIWTLKSGITRLIVWVDKTNRILLQHHKPDTEPCPAWNCHFQLSQIKGNKMTNDVTKENHNRILCLTMWPMKHHNINNIRNCHNCFLWSYNACDFKFWLELRLCKILTCGWEHLSGKHFSCQEYQIKNSKKPTVYSPWFRVNVLCCRNNKSILFNTVKFIEIWTCKFRLHNNWGVSL